MQQNSRAYLLPLRQNAQLDGVAMQKLLKEKATNTQELLRQHVQLQDDARKKDEELLQLKTAKQGLQSQLEAAQAASEAEASDLLGRYAASRCCLCTKIEVTVSEEES